MLRYLTISLIGCGLWALAPARAQGLELLGTTSSPADPRGPIDAVAVPGWLYTANFGSSSLGIYDVRQPTKPQRVSVLAGPARPRRVVVSGSTVYLACYAIGSPITGDVQAVDVSNATAPVELKRVTLPGGPLGIDASNSLVCVVSPAGQLYVFDKALTQLGTVAVPGAWYVALSGTYAYVMTINSLDTEYKLLTYDLRVPATPTLLNTITLQKPSPALGGDRLLLYNNTLYVPQTGEVFSLANPAAPVRQTLFTDRLRSVQGFTAYGLGLNAAGKSTVLVYDVHTPTAPVLAASTVSTAPSPFDSITGVGEYVYALAYSGDYLYVYKNTSSVLSTSPSAPQETGLYPNPSAQEQVSLRLPAATQAQSVRLYNACGQLVREQVLARGSTQATLNLANLAPGLYVVHCGEATYKLVRQ
jgi:hypothetical protein